MNGGHVLQVLALILLFLGGAALAFQLSGDGQPMFWLVAFSPIIMGCGLFIIGRHINRRR